MEPGRWIWEGLRLPADDADIYVSQPQLEQRHVKRAPCLVSAEIIPNAERHPNHRILVFVTNISINGCYVRMPYPLAQGTRVSVALWLDEQRKIWVDGIVVSSQPQEGLGVKFLNVTRRTAETIERCMQTVSETSTYGGISDEAQEYAQ